MKNIKFKIFIILVVGSLILPINFASAEFKGFLGATFEDRQQAYLNSGGSGFGSPIQSVWAWLENPTGHESQIHEEIRIISGDPDEIGCTGSRYFNCFWSGNQPGPIFAMRMYLGYYKNKKVISDSDAQKLKYRLSTMIQMFGCGASNYHYRYIASNYLYANLIEDFDLKFKKPTEEDFDRSTQRHIGTQQCESTPETFTQNGHTYTRGNTYRASQFYKDYLEHEMDYLLRNGSEEDLLVDDYYYAQIHSFALVYDFATDPVIKRKAKMMVDWLVFQQSVNFSAYFNAGGHSTRMYQREQIQTARFFPWYIFYNLNQKSLAMLTNEAGFTELYVTSYRYPKLLADFFEDLNGANANPPDNFYRLVRGNVPAMGPGETSDAPAFNYRYDYITPLYNLGGAGIGTGWQLNIKSDNGPLRLWTSGCKLYPSGHNINVVTIESIPAGETPGCLDDGGKTDTNGWNINSMGGKSAIAQYRNALFSGGNNTAIHTYAYKYSTDAFDNIISSYSGWNFYLEGKVAVAVKLRQGSDFPAAIEVATIDVDYDSYELFKAAVKSKAEILDGYITSTRFRDKISSSYRNQFNNWMSFRTSKGYIIDEASIDYPAGKEDQPFGRLEVWEGHAGKNDEKKVVSWDNNVMTVTRNGSTCKYNFNTWTFSGNGCEGGGNYKADFNQDGKVDIQDFGILLSHWNKSVSNDPLEDLKFIDKTLDLAPNKKIDTADLGALLGCWGTPDREICMEE